MILWPAVTLLGFVVLACVVIALGTRSTARYEFERNRVQKQAQPAAVPAGAGQSPAGDRPAGRPAADRPAAPGRNGGAPVRQRRRERVAASHPAGKGLDRPSGWWLVDESEDQPAARVVAGPFPDRIEADWAALSGGLSDDVRAVYGVPRADGAVVRRQSPQERAWLAELGNQLDRLAEDWDELLTDTDALTTLLVEVAGAVVEAGLPLHDCAERSPAGGGSVGGVCLTPDPGRRGILVSWRQHDRMSLQQVRGAEADAAVQRTMNAAIAGVLAEMGFQVTPFGSTGCHLVTAVDRSALTP
ncbi:hypothetical protein [Geodermatophilus sabuli]|uniref:Uncharacterized protein n=1 Tax=Geodermatophilus sabuli TaxID=1564158 RepID=A0A285E8U2_9ACTN|nr:hypothetical protein [Geodermatophilus sabuli]MBB3085100.1 hypothetical protein [Geodermatophilus sabuli]SNX95492.1 hypothetical protein SAMN06893097_102192 [Geodermatophilus sabuli]